MNDAFNSFIIYEQPQDSDLTLESISVPSVHTCAGPTDYSTSWPFSEDGATAVILKGTSEPPSQRGKAGIVGYHPHSF